MAFSSVPASAFAAAPSDACADLHQAAIAVPRGPVLMASFPSLDNPGRDPDGIDIRPLRETAFVYDNAVAILALLGCGKAADAQRIGDALVYAQRHDRFWQDGRLRNGYVAGWVAGGAMKLTGWWDERNKIWAEDRYQAGSDSGNMAWAMLALLALDQASPQQPAYRDAAINLGRWLEQFRDDTTTEADNPGGFRGGTFGHEPQPDRVGWKSTEHNTDLAAAYAALARATGDAQWRQDADAAGAFVTAMWQAERGCYATGTAEDGKTRNSFVALDAQIWPLLALATARPQMAAIKTRCLPGLRQSNGYAYSATLQGIWTEGTAQAAVLMKLTGDDDAAALLLQQVDALHDSGPGGGFYATDREALPTGFALPTDPGKPRLYFHLSHLGATAWAALAQSGINPFTGRPTLP